MKNRVVSIIKSCSYLILLALIFIIFIIFIGNRCGLIGPSLKNALTLFELDKKDILIVTKYLDQSEHSVALIKGTGDTMYVGYSKKIEDDNVIEAINSLFNKGYKCIEKMGDTICFVRWTKLSGFSSGILFSSNSETKPKIPFLIKLESLSIDNWYYYEENIDQYQ